MLLRTVVIALVLAFAGCSATTTSPQATVESLGAWRELGVTDYRYKFQQDCFCIPDVREPVEIYVRGGEVVQVISQVDSGSRDPSLWPTIEEIYRRVDEARANGIPVEISGGDQGLPVAITIGTLANDAGVTYRLGRVIPL